MVLVAHYDLKFSSNGCENCPSKWKFRWRSVHG